MPLKLLEGLSAPDMTQTCDEPLGAVPRTPTPQARPVAPLQFRDPDRYDVLGEQGRGGFGRVLRAHDKELGRPVAIKELISRGGDAEVRFLREALIPARLDHPGIVTIYEAGRWPNGTPFYVMKLLAGSSLKELLSRCVSAEARLELVPRVLSVADAIAHAHARQVIHRDLKPANAIVGEFGETVVIDWGLAKDLRSAGPFDAERPTFESDLMDDLTVAGSVLGTPRYMAPEQRVGARVDQRADVYAIGAMLWDLCAIEPNLPADPQERERALRGSRIDPDLVAIVKKAMAQNPGDRYCDAGALAIDLQGVVSGHRTRALAAKLTS